MIVFDKGKFFEVRGEEIRAIVEKKGNSCRFLCHSSAHTINNDEVRPEVISSRNMFCSGGD